jgi:hypothetical protein
MEVIMKDLYGRTELPWNEKPPCDEHSEYDCPICCDPDDFSQTDLDLAEAWLEIKRGGSLSTNNDREVEK